MFEHTDIFALTTSEQSNYETLPVPIMDGWEWSMYEHIRKTVLYKNSEYASGSKDASGRTSTTVSRKDTTRPFKNITRPILNLQYRAEGFDVKDIELFVDDAEEYYKSFLVQKFHDDWAREHNIDTFIDDMVEAYVDFGGVLIKEMKEARPEVVPWQRVAFCDQTDILSGPIAEKHYFNPDQLKDMEANGWENIDELIVMSGNKKEQAAQGIETKTPAKYIEVFEIHGVLPESWLLEDDEEDTTEETSYVGQMHIISFFTDENDTQQGITLFKRRESESPYKFLARDKVYGRALGFGGAEELFEPQVWVNYDMIRIKGMLDAASKIILQTSDTSFSTRNKIMGVDNGEVLVTAEGKRIEQINMTPANITVFENSVAQWEDHAKQMGAANESILGEQPKSGTPFALQQLVTAESHSLHEYRKGKLATFLDEIYRDWIIPHISKEITKGQKFLAELDIDELQEVAESVARNEANEAVKEKILNGDPIFRDEAEAFKATIQEDFVRGGNTRFVEILKDEMKDAAIAVKTNIAGKQKYMAAMTDKLVNVFRTIVANPQVLQSPPMAKLFNEILESSGLNPIDFSGVSAPQQIEAAPVARTEPLAEVSATV
ncbi:hypothetical protein CMI37_10495 [Candidatus Pacearchaeota archaeon]|nr:hypothetical protein [Candidatus Pacearchaeota archaeon]|tara:strand:- start:2656 stop:4473 length:1818 start_codon:yes stop_codon:yes gene_type:complete